MGRADAEQERLQFVDAPLERVERLRSDLFVEFGLDELDQLAPKLKAPGREGSARIIAAAHRVPKRAKMKAPEIKSFPLAPVLNPIETLNPLMLSSTPGRIHFLPLLI